MMKALVTVLLLDALSPFAIGGEGRESGKDGLAGAKGKIALKVDLALPPSEKNPMPVAGTLKRGWAAFVAARWADMYMHDAVWEDGSGSGTPPKTAGLAGSGVHVLIDCGGRRREGHKAILNAFKIKQIK